MNWHIKWAAIALWRCGRVACVQSTITFCYFRWTLDDGTTESTSFVICFNLNAITEMFAFLKLVRDEQIFGQFDDIPLRCIRVRRHRDWARPRTNWLSQYSFRFHRAMTCTYCLILHFPCRFDYQWVCVCFVCFVCFECRSSFKHRRTI